MNNFFSRDNNFLSPDDMFFWEGGNVEPYKYKKSLRYKQDRKLLLDFIKYINVDISNEYVNNFLKNHYEGGEGKNE